MWLLIKLYQVSQLDDWVLCRIYKKINKQLGAGGERSMECEDTVEDAVAAYPTHAAAAMAVAGGGAHHNGNYTSLINRHHEDNFLDGFMTAEDTGLSAGASSLNQLAAAARAAAPAEDTSKQQLQLLLPSSTATPFNWLDASAFTILPPAKRFHTTDGGGTSLSSPSERGNLVVAGAVDSGACSGGTNAIVPTFLNPLGVQGATTAYHHHAILGTPVVTPEAAAAATATCGFQHPYQLSGMNNWNP